MIKVLQFKLISLIMLILHNYQVASMDLNYLIASKLDLPIEKVINTIVLLKDDNTVPFIARYRKEITGNLDEVAIRSIEDELARLEVIEKRQKTILKSLEAQGNLSENLQEQILAAASLTQLEDIYQPYRPKRRTRAMEARERGLEPLAALILDQLGTDQELHTLVDAYITKDVPSLETAISGASDIVAEWISDNAAIRQQTRERFHEFGELICKKRKGAVDERKVYGIYYEFQTPVKYLKPHQILAINRGENEGILRANLQIKEDAWREVVNYQYPLNPKSVFYEILIAAIHDSAQRLLLPAIERDIRRALTEKAEQHAIDIFAQNLIGVLTQPPLAGQVVLAIDPGFRSGSKIAVVDPTGKLLDTATIYPHPPQSKTEDAYRIVNALIQTHSVTLIVIGNGTASRETEIFVAEFTKKNNNIHYLITSEAGASVYSASELARDEFPDLDVSIRGAISIARRVQDPLAELVKIDPKSIGVGLYQHDINQTKLSESLNAVVESVVNMVGVEVNTASAALLSHVSGIGQGLAEKTVQFREENGPFKNRNSLLNIPGMGAKTFQQSAGFLRVRNSENFMDNTAIHPESYPLARKIIQDMGLSPDAKIKERTSAVNNFRENNDLKTLANALNAGEQTIGDILNELAKPGRDPREDLPKPILRKDVIRMSDLTPGMELMGTIRNIVDFGAFVDIGVKIDGLLHKSRYAKEYQLKVGENIKVNILAVDAERQRISLDMQERTKS